MNQKKKEDIFYMLFNMLNDLLLQFKNDDFEYISLNTWNNRKIIFLCRGFPRIQEAITPILDLYAFKNQHMLYICKMLILHKKGNNEKTYKENQVKNWWTTLIK